MFSKMSTERELPDEEQLAKMLAYKKASATRSREGTAVPLSKSKAKNRKAAKAARKARKK